MCSPRVRTGRGQNIYSTCGTTTYEKQVGTRPHGQNLKMFIHHRRLNVWVYLTPFLTQKRPFCLSVVRLDVYTVSPENYSATAVIRSSACAVSNHGWSLQYSCNTTSESSASPTKQILVAKPLTAFPRRANSGARRPPGTLRRRRDHDEKSADYPRVGGADHAGKLVDARVWSPSSNWL